MVAVYNGDPMNVCRHCRSELIDTENGFTCRFGCREPVFTFLTTLDINRGNQKSKGAVTWDVVIYRSGVDYDDARKKVQKDFDNPLVLFSCEGRIEPISGRVVTDVEFDPNTPYVIEQQCQNKYF